MTTHIDRSGLESAVAIADRLLSDEDRAPGTYIPMTAAHLDQLYRAARAHLETLPRTKMVEVWRVEYAFKSTSADHFKGWAPNEWRACADTFASEALARAALAKWSADKPAAEAACHKVTGPHQQCVPA